MFQKLILLLVLQSWTYVDALSPKNNKMVFEAIQLEYSEMASWYDWFWKSYTHETLKIPLDIVASEEVETFAKRRAMTVVDVACGTGEFLRRFRSNTFDQNFPKHRLRLFGVEPCKAMLDQARPKLLDQSSLSHSPRTQLALRQAPAERLPLRSQSADVVVSTNAFHFFRNKIQALSEMKRVLKDNTGTLVITDWCQNYWMVKMYHLLECIRWNGRFSEQYPGPLSRQNLVQLLTEAGFVVQKHKCYLVRVFVIFPWGMQTIVARKKGKRKVEKTTRGISE